MDQQENRDSAASGGVNVENGQVQTGLVIGRDQHNVFLNPVVLPPFPAIRSFTPEKGASVPGRPTLTLVESLDKKEAPRVWVAQTPDAANRLVLKFALNERDKNCLEKELTTCRVLMSVLGRRDEFQAPTEWKEAGGVPYIEYEYLTSGDLIQWAESRRGLSTIPLSTRIGIVIDLARMVEEVHNQKVYHNDLSADNVLVRRARWQAAPAPSSISALPRSGTQIGSKISSTAPAGSGAQWTRTTPSQRRARPASARSDSELRSGFGCPERRVFPRGASIPACRWRLPGLARARVGGSGSFARP